MIKQSFHYLVLSDIHLYHPKTRTHEIIEHLDAYFQYYQPGTDFTRLDCLFIAGDLFDNLSDFSSDESHRVNLWLARLLTFCVTYRIKLRVLEGTPSHDWKQSKIIDIIIEVMGLSIDYKYIDVLSIETMDNGLTVLYIPDEWTTSSALTQQQVSILLRENNLSEVDIAMIHGMFGYQLPNVPHNKHCHSESYYLGIVKYVISIGHIHTYTQYERIIAQGSFDRLRHNEEEAKGGVYITLYPNGDYDAVFVENKLAKSYITITFRDCDIEKSKIRLQNKIKSLADDSYIRIKSSKDHPFFVGLESLKNQYLQFNFSRISLDKEDTKQQLLNMDSVVLDYQPLTITEDNIISLLWQQIDAKYTLTPQEREYLTTIIENN